MQINLQNCRAATNQLIITATEKDIDLILVQDIYTKNNIVTGIPQNWTKFFSTTNLAGILIRNPSLKIINTLTTNHSVFISIQDLNENVIIGSFYSPPSHNLEENLAEWTTLMEDKIFIVGGDFNGKHQIWGCPRNDTRGHIIINYCTEHNVCIMNNPEQLPTYYTPYVTGHPDLTLCSPKIEENFYDWTVLEDITNSDHRYITYHITSKFTLKYNIRYKSKYGKKNIFKKKIVNFSNSIETTMQQIQTEDDLEQFIPNFYNAMYEICNKVYRKKKYTCNRKITWWNENLRKERNRLNAVYKRYKRTNNEQVKLLFKQLKANYQKSINREKIKSWTMYCRKTTETFGNVFNIARDKVFNQNYLIHTKLDGMPINSTQTDVEKQLLKHHFQTQTISLPIYSEYYTRSHQFSPFNYYELKSAIEQQNANKAPGNDLLDPRIIKLMFKHAPSILLNLYNKIIFLQYIPTKWKEAIVIFFHKKNKPPIDPGSYRPICLLQTISKIFEKLINNRIQYQLNSIQFFNTNQFGFIENRSTIDCLHTLLEEIKLRKQRHKYIILISFDIMGAFDNVNWQILYDSIKEMNIDQYLKNIIYNYLHNRTAGISNNNIYESIKVTKGCPQGSCLGPLLWNIIANKILSDFDSNEEKLIAYADDFILIASEDSRIKLETQANKSIDKFYQLCFQQQLKISPNKTEALIIGKDLSRRNPVIKLNNESIAIKNKIKYLGVIIDNKMNFIPHLHYLEEAITKFVINTKRLSTPYNRLSPTITRIWYITVTEAKLLYNIQNWFQFLNCKTRSKLVSIQRKFLIRIINSYRSVSTDALHCLTGIPPIDIKAQKIRQLHEFKYNNQPLNVSSLTICYDDIEKRNIRKETDPTNYPSNIKFTTTYENQKSTTPDYNTQNLLLFTDGSKTQNATGFGYLIIKDNKTIFTAQRRLQEQNSIFQAEALAILEGLKWTKDKPDVNIEIFTDSQSCIYSLQNLTPKSPIILEILQLCHSTPNKHYIFNWTKAHIGQTSNELADILAKFSLLLPTITTYPLPITIVKKHFKNQLLQDWQYRWDNSLKGRATYEVCPKIKEKLRFKNVALTYFVTGHGSFPSYLYKIKKLNNPNCPCGVPGTPTHYSQNSCSFCPIFIKKSPSESLLNYYKRIDSIPCLTKKINNIYNLLNKKFSFISLNIS